MSLLHLYDRALLNAAALRAVGYDRDTPEPPGGEIQRDSQGNPTGLLMAKPNAAILYATLAMGPKLPEEYQLNSTRHYMRELNRLGITGALDAGGGFQRWPDDYGVIRKLAVGNLADLTVLDRDYMSCPEDEITAITARLTMVGGNVVWGAGEYAPLDPGAPLAMPDWSPVNRYGGYGAWAASAEGSASAALNLEAATSCGCASACSVHGHDHARSWTARLPTADLKSFWGALGCACWA